MFCPSQSLVNFVILEHLFLFGFLHFCLVDNLFCGRWNILIKMKHLKYYEWNKNGRKYNRARIYKKILVYKQP
jgi:hypothetical protein